MSSAAAAKVSPGQEQSNMPSTLAGVCLEAIARHDKPDAVSEKREGQWVRISAAEFVRRVRHIALGLADLGIRPKDRVALISENLPGFTLYFSQANYTWVASLKGRSARVNSGFGTVSKPTTQYWDIQTWEFD